MRALLLLVLWAGPLAAQQASAYLPLDHWTMPYIEHLIAARVMADPTPLTRPLREADVARALRDVDTLTTSADRKSTRLNSSHSQISYAVFCLKKKKHQLTTTHPYTTCLPRLLSRVITNSTSMLQLDLNLSADECVKVSLDTSREKPTSHKSCG